MVNYGFGLVFENPEFGSVWWNPPLVVEIRVYADEGRCDCIVGLTYPPKSSLNYDEQYI